MLMLTGNVGAGVQVRFHWQVMLIDDTRIGGAPFFRVTLNLRAAPQKYLWVFNTNSIYKIKGNKQKLIPVFFTFLLFTHFTSTHMESLYY